MSSFWKALGASPYSSLKTPGSDPNTAPNSGPGSPRAAGHPHAHAHVYEPSHLGGHPGARDDGDHGSSSGTPGNNSAASQPVSLAAALAKIVPLGSASGYAPLPPPVPEDGGPHSSSAAAATFAYTGPNPLRPPQFVRPQPSRPSVDPTDPSDFLEHFLSSSSSSARDSSTSSGAAAQQILDPKFYLESFDAVRHTLEMLGEEEGLSLDALGSQFRMRVQQLDSITEQLATQVMSHHKEMVEAMQLHGDMERDLRTLSIIAKNGRRHLSRAMEEVSNDLVVAASVQRKRMLTTMIPLLLRMQQVLEVKNRLEEVGKKGDFAKALRLCSECLVVIEQNNYFASVQDMNKNIEEWLTRTVEAVDSMLFEVCRNFNSASYARVVDAYAVMDDAAALAEKAQNYFAQSVVTETYDTLLQFLDQAVGEDDGRRSRLSYNELCLQLPDGVFRACLQRTLEALFEILCSHFMMMTWQHPMALDAGTGDVLSPGIGSTASEGAEGHRRADSAPLLEQGAMTEGGTQHRTQTDGGPSQAAERPMEAAPSGVEPTPENLGAVLVRAGSVGGDSVQGGRLAREQRRQELSRGNSDKERRASDQQQGEGSLGPVDRDGSSSTSSATTNSTHAAVPDGDGTKQRPRTLSGSVAAVGQASDSAVPRPEATHRSLGVTGRTASAPDYRCTQHPSQSGSSTALVPVLSSSGIPGIEGRGQNGALEVLDASDTLSPKCGSERTGEHGGRLGDIPPSVARRMRLETTAAVRRALEKGRKAVWELASRRLSSLISSDALCSGSSQQFLQSLEWVDRFILVGESFTQSEAVGLRAKVTKQSEKYFKIFHYQNLEVLRTIIERESWQRLPPSALSTLTLTGLIGAPQSFLASPPMPTLSALSMPPAASLSPGLTSSTSPTAASTAAATTMPVVGTRSHEVRWSFTEWMGKGNPFAAAGTGDGTEAEVGSVSARWKASLLPKANTIAASSVAAPAAEQTAADDGGLVPGGPQTSFSLNGTAETAGPLALVGSTGAAAAAATAGTALYSTTLAHTDHPAAADGATSRAANGVETAASLRLRQRQIPHPHSQDQEDSEDEEELMADYIDEEGRTGKAAGARRQQRKSAAGRRARGRQRGVGLRRGRPGQGGAVGVSVLSLALALTGASLSMIRLMDRYARLMQILKPIATEIFQGLCQLFELYFVSIFRLFGNNDTLLSFRIPQAEPSFMPELSVKLRSAVARMNQSLEQQHHQAQQLAAQKNKSRASPGGAAGAPGSSTTIGVQAALGEALGSLVNGVDLSGLGSVPFSSPTSAAAAAQLLSASNLYGLKERCVAMESLMWLADLLEESRAKLQHLLQPTALPVLEAFFTKSVDAVPDLWEHVLRTLTRKLLNIGSYPERIAASQWEIKQQLGTQHNQYVEALLSEFQLYMHKLSQSGTPAQVQEQLIDYGIELVGEVLVEGFARVKRCTNEGRALMSLDLQVLSSGLEQLSGTEPDLQIVEHYIKAFYLPETEFLHWARTHPEYSKSQVLALINLVATVNNWKRKARVDLVERIETGDYFS